MKTRFKIPKAIESLMNHRHKQFFQLTESDIADVQRGIDSLRGDKTKCPQITVGIIAYNEEMNLFAMLQSIALQVVDFSVEVILVDNNSSDNTALLAHRCGVKVVAEQKQGIAFARQKMLSVAEGMFCACCDADTLYPPHWLSTLISPLVANRAVSVTYSLHSLIDENERYAFGFYAYQYAKLVFVYLQAMKRGQLNCGGASMAFRVGQAREVGGYNTQLLRGADGYIALKLSAFGSVSMVADKRAFIYTSNRRTLHDGALWVAFFIRFKYGIRHMFSFLTTQKIPTS